MFARLDRRRARDFHFLAPAVLALAGGGQARILSLPALGQPLVLSEIERLARRLGYRGAALDRAVRDVCSFDDFFLAAQSNAARAAIERLNGC